MCIIKDVEIIDCKKIKYGQGKTCNRFHICYRFCWASDILMIRYDPFLLSHILIIYNVFYLITKVYNNTEKLCINLSLISKV